MSKEAVVLTLASLATDFKGQYKVLFEGRVSAENCIGDLSDSDHSALQSAALQTQEWIGRYDLAGPGGGTNLMDAGFALFADLLRAYNDVEYPGQ